MPGGRNCGRPVRRVEIAKPGGKGVRLLGIPTVRNRVVQTTLKLLLEPIFDSHFPPHNYGFRPRRSQHQAVQAAQQVWETLQSLSHNDKKLRGDPGVIAVLHTHSRKLDYDHQGGWRCKRETGVEVVHPHIHAVMPATVVDRLNKLTRTKQGKYLFNHKALAKVFRGKLLSKLAKANLILPKAIPQKWVVNCKQVGTGDKALMYLGRYLYRGVIREKDILSIRDGKVTFRYQNSDTKHWETRTETGAKFLWLVLQHILPTGFRRARNYGFLHPNSKVLITILRCLGKLNSKKILEKISLRQRPQLTCKCCGGKMEVRRTRIPVVKALFELNPNTLNGIPT